MFTGIIEEVGEIKRMNKSGPVVEITIGCDKILEDMHIGDSISVNGTCLTVTSFTNESFTVDMIQGTESITYIAKLKQGDRVNLERALLATGRLGGHFVQGHVDGQGTIASIKASENEWIYTIKCDEKLLNQMVQQGAIAVDGISLTIFKLTQTYFEIHLIPETRKATILKDKSTGDPVHLETDMLFKYVEKLSQQKGSELTKEKLLKYGF
ncbi:riboflavin synthase [Staphylococcus massiliensis]|uniref:Riboflavin synthase n=1 Tax=Staphylococcus massiliensis S46 TaxID=1229783 RepID=K9B637_9STAP|nr:riboflavin synthase [Staphylococcus massiliensis]EKU50282.1 riboflavin synthase subunit alpha [Staphylococcus massiliensis S46]MCG3399692.1 riboflavin synthase [Staphylococcus massiliensis]MCG3400797.1 riboflavin synthase [Staphylococcus massiliensis]MCG3412039.1 riboflavin synthase [Staphylococcus massiliensis]PNZ98640.1 riboflavin synthase [Staphylococcus massiliensis CCUG 55927]